MTSQQYRKKWFCAFSESDTQIQSRMSTTSQLLQKDIPGRILRSTIYKTHELFNIGEMSPRVQCSLSGTVT